MIPPTTPTNAKSRKSGVRRKKIRSQVRTSKIDDPGGQGKRKVRTSVSSYHRMKAEEETAMNERKRKKEINQLTDGNDEIHTRKTRTHD